MVAWLTKGQVVRLLKSRSVEELFLEDGEKAFFGTGRDGEIFFDGSDLIITTTAGDMTLSPAVDLNLSPTRNLKIVADNITLGGGGQLAIAANFTLTGGGVIDTTLNGNIVLLPNGTGLTVIGDAGSSSRGLNANDDLFVSGKIEVDGTSFFEGVATFLSPVQIAVNQLFIMGATGDFHFQYSQDQTPKASTITVGQHSRGLIIFESDDRTFDFAHPQQTNPTLFIHSANQSTTEWVSMTHDGTDGIIATGVGRIGFPGAVRFDGNIVYNALSTFFGTPQCQDNVKFRFGSSGDAHIEYDTDQAADCLRLGLSEDSNIFLINETVDEGFNHEHAQQPDPTLFIHSTNQSTTEWIKFTHDRTDGVIDCGTGTLNLGGTANVNFAGASRTASTVTHDAYVELEIAGTAYKFMLGA